MSIPDVVTSGNRCELHGGIIDCPCQPERITISLPALRATILAAINDGDEASDKASGVIFRLPWPIDHPWADVANDARLRFCDEIERRLRQLPARG